MSRTIQHRALNGTVRVGLTLNPHGPSFPSFANPDSVPMPFGSRVCRGCNLRRTPTEWKGKGKTCQNCQGKKK